MKIHYALEIYLTNPKPSVKAVRLKIMSVIYFWFSKKYSRFLEHCC